MKIITDIHSFPNLEFSVATIGMFDGMHIGHQAILKKLISEAKSYKNGKSILITFWPHPRIVLNHKQQVPILLNTFEEKAEQLAILGLDYILKIAFTKDFSTYSAEKFLTEILVKSIKVKKLLVGYDHHFGNNREGNLDFLRKKSAVFNFEVIEIKRKSIDQEGVGSTKIRNILGESNVQLANKLLGRPYTIQGKVVQGQGRGKTIGFPTANIHVAEPYKLFPKDGVYIINASIDEKRYKGILNIGFNPTINNKHRTVEAHLLNVNLDLYGKMIKIYFMKYLREEIKFLSLAHLKTQLLIDKEKAIAFDTF